MTTVRLTVGGDKFEILVKADAALNFKQGKKLEMSQVLAADEIYTDSSKGDRASSEKLKKAFHTDNLAQVAEMILRRGELQLTTEQRHRMVEDKKKQIVTLIAKNYVDPKTNLPHPPLRIEQAMLQIRLAIDPFKPAEEQAKKVIDELRVILPLKTGNVKLAVRADASFAPQVLGILKQFGNVSKEEWREDGGLNAVIELPIAMQRTLLDRLGSATKGNAQATPLE
ncbi:MAG: ribosome assembly factor SBDS [Nitrososphaerota archaeon]|jgi:ribosome maturation protein SDO1|nr:ribosome assembly factor SBDS [Nitrososphaerota archaeon]